MTPEERAKQAINEYTNKWVKTAGYDPTDDFMNGLFPAVACAIREAQLEARQAALNEAADFLQGYVLGDYPFSMVDLLVVAIRIRALGASGKEGEK